MPDSAALAAARALFDAGKYPAAEKAFAQLASAQRDNAEIADYLGRLALRRDDTDQAIDCFERAVALAPECAGYHRDLGDAYGRAAQTAMLLWKLGLAKKALAQYQRAVALAPASVEFRQSLFEYYRQAPEIAGGGLAKARAEAAVVARLDPLRGHYCRALLEVSAHETEAAFRELDAALRLAPDDYASLFQYGQLAANTGQHFERGLAAFRRCLELPPSWPPNTPHFGAHMWIGWMLEKQHDLAGARAAYEAALRLEPRFKPAAEALARIARKS
jgi:tetratricopeptide (TPR) repeat protein